MKRRLYKAVLLLMCTVLLLSAIPASAADTQGMYDVLTVGTGVYYGKYTQAGVYEPEDYLEWIVLDKTDDKVLLVSRYIVERVVYDSTGDDGYPAWHDSTVRSFLNDNFLQSAFTARERQYIKSTKVTNDVKDTNDKIFLLSAAEAKKYFRTAEDRQTQATDYAWDNVYWIAESLWEEDEYDRLAMLGKDEWLLRPDGYFVDAAAYVDSAGIICEAYGNGLGGYVNGLRPAMWVDRNAPDLYVSYNVFF